MDYVDLYNLLYREEVREMMPLLRATFVASVLVGATKTRHIDSALGALDLVLSEEEIAALEAPYVAHEVVGPVADPRG